jgi:hypothetical protein
MAKLGCLSIFAEKDHYFQQKIITYKPSIDLPPASEQLSPLFNEAGAPLRQPNRAANYLITPLAFRP